jgi:O-acetyl-ADP-ribose deacetylase (regulator of RNase III)/predicted Ser/Thr protein kinase
VGEPAPPFDALEDEPTGPIRGGMPVATPVPRATLEAAIGSRYEISREVARGGMGVIYCAYQRALDRQVAIKVVLPGASPDRFRREARLLARVRSPHTVAVHDYEVLADGSPMLVMEWVDGCDLLQAMQRSGGALDEAAALPLMRDVCLGMTAAAEHGIVHRDLKPTNILVDGSGRARVADFGLARGPAFDPSISFSGEVLGTPFYMAPEQWEDPQTTDTRSDVYSFGATFYHALTGTAPFLGRSPVAVLLAHKTEPLISPRARNPRLSDHTSDVLERCLAKAPADRFPSFDDLLRHLDTRPSGPVASAWNDDEDPALAAHVQRYAARRETYVLRLLTPAEVDEYHFPGQRVIRILRGDILEQAVEAIVSSDDGSLTMSDGVSRAIRDAAGPSVLVEARRYAPVRAGRAIVTSGGRLRPKYVFHGITLEFSRDPARRPSRDLISEIMASCFYHADSLYVETIAFPLLGTGTAGFAEDVCLDAMFHFLARTFQHRATGVREARVVLFP